MSHPRRSFPIDNSAILYFSQLQNNHSNVYRFSVTLSEEICPATLQQAADGVCSRFPTIIAGFHPGFFSYSVIPAQQAPAVSRDPGLLRTMGMDEIRSCAYRIYYNGCTVSIEAFHALTDGYGAICSLRTLIAEYLRLRYGVISPEQTEMLQQSSIDWQSELHDAYLPHGKEKPGSVPNRRAYQLPAHPHDWTVKTVSRQFSTQKMLAAARARGVSLTAFLSCIMAECIMEIQQREKKRRMSPVRIMVPVDLRRLFPSRTLRNFVLYALPTIEVKQALLERKERMQKIHQQLKEQISPAYLVPQMARNVRMQASWLYRMIPRAIKCLALQMIYRFMGEINSSITLTNLGNVTFSDPLKPYIRDMEVMLTPRRKSPYNCAVISMGDSLRVNVTRFAASAEVEDLFFQKLHTAIE